MWPWLLWLRLCSTCLHLWLLLVRSLCLRALRLLWTRLVRRAALFIGAGPWFHGFYSGRLLGPGVTTGAVGIMGAASTADAVASAADAAASAADAAASAADAAASAADAVASAADAVASAADAAASVADVAAAVDSTEVVEAGSTAAAVAVEVPMAVAMVGATDN